MDQSAQFLEAQTQNSNAQFQNLEAQKLEDKTLQGLARLGRGKRVGGWV